MKNSHNRIIYFRLSVVFQCKFVYSIKMNCL